jgi:hypothetical protein
MAVNAKGSVDVVHSLGHCFQSITCAPLGLAPKVFASFIVNAHASGRQKRSFCPASACTGVLRVIVSCIKGRDIFE